MSTSRLRPALAASIVLVATALFAALTTDCGPSEAPSATGSGRSAESASTQPGSQGGPVTQGATTTSPPFAASGPATTAGNPTTANPTTVNTAPPTTVAVTPTTAGFNPTATTTIVLGPEWRQQDGKILIEATASGDTQTLLRDLQALGLTDGVAFGRLVNGWLPIGAFPAAQRLSSLLSVRPTGAGTGS